MIIADVSTSYYTRIVEDVDWQHGAEHMWSQHQVSVEQANEALDDADAVVIDPDTKSRSGQSARIIGYSPSAGAVITVILVRREDKPGAWWGANGWPANTTDRRTYQKQNEETESSDD